MCANPEGKQESLFPFGKILTSTIQFCGRPNSTKAGSANRASRDTAGGACVTETAQTDNGFSKHEQGSTGRFVGDDLSEKKSKGSSGRVPSGAPPNRCAGFVYILLEHDGTVM